MSSSGREAEHAPDPLSPGSDENCAAEETGRVREPTPDGIQIFMADSSTPDEEVSENFRQLLAHYHQSEQARLDRAKAQLRTDILPALRTHRVANVEAAYSGYGDSGAIDGIQYRDEAGVRVDRTTLPTPVIEQLENVLYEFLPSGFEINDGGQGTLTLDVQTGKVTIQHQENYTETRDSTREFTL
jgi:hypothetical protein